MEGAAGYGDLCRQDRQPNADIFRAWSERSGRSTTNSRSTRRLRYALVNGRPVNELRAGVTFGFPLNLGRPSPLESSSAMPVARH